MVDAETGEEFYGIKAKANGRWLDLGENGEAIFYRTRKARNAKLKQLRKLLK